MKTCSNTVYVVLFVEVTEDRGCCSSYCMFSDLCRENRWFFGLGFCLFTTSCGRDQPNRMRSCHSVRQPSGTAPGWCSTSSSFSGTEKPGIDCVVCTARTAGGEWGAGLAATCAWAPFRNLWPLRVLLHLYSNQHFVPVSHSLVGFQALFE